MSTKDFMEVLDRILEEDDRYDRYSYLFVRQALDHTIKSMGRSESSDRRSHVSPGELLEGIREFALEQYGPMAMTVLQEWGIKRTEDFGEIIFNLVEKGTLGTSPDDKKEDFADGYDFHEAFELPFLPKSQLGE